MTSQQKRLSPAKDAPVVNTSSENTDNNAVLIQYKQNFLDALAVGHSVRSAAKAAGVKPATPYGWREHDTAFARAWRAAEEAGTDIIEEEAFRRAVDGVQKPVYRAGEVVGHIADYSDTMLMFLLKARRPERYAAPTKATGKTKDTDPLNLKGTRDALISKFLAVHDKGQAPEIPE